MFCNHCNTPFEIVSIEDGKSKYCKKCGHLIYKKVNNSIVIYSAIETPEKNDDEQELRERIQREKELRYKEQLERKQKEQQHRERLEKERLIQEKIELERKLKEREEQEKIFQLQLEEEKKLKEKLIQEQIETEKQERERLENELAAQRERQQKEAVEKEREILELAAREKEQAAIHERQLLAIAEKERIAAELTRAEQERLAAIEQQRIATEQQIAEQKRQLALIEQERLENERLLQQEKETARIQLAANKKPSSTIYVNRNASKQKIAKYAVPVLVILLAVVASFYLKNKIPTLFKTSSNKALASADTNYTSFNAAELNADSNLIQQLKTNLIGKEIISWNAVKPNDIKRLSILSATKSEQENTYNIQVNLEENTNTKALVELSLQYNKDVLNQIKTNKITYSNIAPVNAWFSFAPVPNCSITINTNNNPIQLKTCDNCTVSKMVCDSETPVNIDNATEIYIKSDNRYSAIVEFTYTPVNMN